VELIKVIPESNLDGSIHLQDGIKKENNHKGNLTHDPRGITVINNLTARSHLLLEEDK
jgi:hypothetical protein